MRSRLLPELRSLYENTEIDSEHGGSGTELSDILESIEKQQYALLKERGLMPDVDYPHPAFCKKKMSTSSQR